MYLSNRDIKWAIDCGKLVVDPRPEHLSPQKGYDETSIDLHLGPASKALIWDIKAMVEDESRRGRRPKDGRLTLNLGDFNYNDMSGLHLKEVPDDDSVDNKVYRKGDEIYVRQTGFLL